MVEVMPVHRDFDGGLFDRALKLDCNFRNVNFHFACFPVLVLLLLDSQQTFCF